MPRARPMPRGCCRWRSRCPASWGRPGRCGAVITSAPRGPPGTPGTNGAAPAPAPAPGVPWALPGTSWTRLEARRDRDLLWVTLADPERANALSPALIGELTALYGGPVREDS